MIQAISHCPALKFSGETAADTLPVQVLFSLYDPSRRRRYRHSAIGKPRALIAGADAVGDIPWLPYPSESAIYDLFWRPRWRFIVQEGRDHDVNWSHAVDGCAVAPVFERPNPRHHGTALIGGAVSPTRFPSREDPAAAGKDLSTVARPHARQNVFGGDQAGGSSHGGCCRNHQRQYGLTVPA